MVRIVQKPGAGGVGAVTIVGDPPISAVETAPGVWEISYADLQELITFTKDVATVQEEGVTIDDINFAWTYNRNGDNPTSQSINQGIGAIAVALRAYNLGPAAGIVADTTWTISAVGDDGNPSSLNTSINFVYPFYYGVGAQGLNGAQVGALTKLIQAQGDKTLAFAPVVEVYYFAYPDAYPALTTILDGNGFDITADWTLHVEAITGLDGNPIDYKIYEFNNLNSTAQNITFNF
jgi:hypothetical protein